MIKMIVVGVFIVLPNFSFSQNLELTETASGDTVVGTTMFNMRHNVSKICQDSKRNQKRIKEAPDWLYK